jgi:hypothetical protein
MAGGESGRRGIPSLLNQSSDDDSVGQEHIAADVTQVRFLSSHPFFFAVSVFFLSIILLFASFHLGIKVAWDFFFAKIARDIYCSWVLQLIGWTPLIELKRITRDDGIHARIVGKVEAYQPLCSVKDRSALRFHSFSLFFRRLVNGFRWDFTSFSCRSVSGHLLL